MARLAHARLRLLAATTALAAGLGPLLPASAGAATEPAATAQETVVPATLRDSGLSAMLRASSTGSGHDSAGAQGVFHTLEGTSGLLWTRFADGESVPVPAAPAGTSATPTGSDVLAYKYADGRVDFWDAADGSRIGLRIPAGLGYLTSYDGLVIGYRAVTTEDGTSTREMHLLTPAPDGTTGDVTVTGGPAGLVLGTTAGADARTVYFRASVAGEAGLVAVDRASGEVRGWSGPLPVSYAKVALGGGHVVVYAADKATVLVLPRDLSSGPVEVRLQGVVDGASATTNLAVVGDWLVNGVYATTAQPLTGGERVTLLRTSQSGTAVGPDGTAVKVGTAPTGERGIWRLTPGADGTRPVVTLVKALPRPALPIQGLSLEQGRLVVMDYPESFLRTDSVRSVAASGTPVFGERSPFTTDVVTPTCAATDVACGQIHGTADGRVVWLSHDDTTDRISVHGPQDGGVWQRTGLPQGGRVTDVSGQYVLFTAPTVQYVFRIGDDGAPTVIRTPGAAALSGDVLWTAGATPGTVTAYSLTTRTTVETVTTDAGCAPTELQALGRYLYWTCGDKAGVYDRTAKKSVAVPAGEARLGDGFVVTHDRRAGKLTLTTVADGTAVGRVIGDLPDTGASQRDVRWTVDESGANAAYVDDKEQVHLVPSRVAQQPLRLLAPVTRATSVSAHSFDTVPDTLTTLLLSKPSSGWDLTVRNRATGKVYGDGVDGTAARGALSVGWSGLDPRGTGDAYLPNGSYDWTVTVTPADGVGAPLTVSGTVRLVRGAAVQRDHVGDDGVGDLLTLDSSGVLAFQKGTGTGTFSGKVSGSGWPTSARFVAFGDLSGDRCNDVLVRLSSGALRAYRPGCGAALKPSTPYTSLGTSGWNQYDVLTAPGDVTRDGRPDLIARNSSTGALYLYKGTSAGKLSARVKLSGDWRGYKKVVGAGDLNGDGIGDLLAQDGANNLYRYYGKGNGTFGARTKLFANWGGSYNAIVGVGDITGDGKADLVERDTAGNVYRNTGDGRGSFGARVKIASGWKAYKGIF